MIEAKNLYAGYDPRKPVLKDFTYSFDRKIYGILGGSGCGKTTLLRTVAGLLKPLSGQVIINGEMVSKVNSDVYMMHQNYTSFDWRTCLDNILIAKEIKGKVTSADEKAAKDFLIAVGLSGKENSYPRQLSGGQRQRLALARTLFMNPGIIMMDEPLSALDHKTRTDMQDLIIQRHRETKNTIILVTHSRDEAEKMCDKIIEF